MSFKVAQLFQSAQIDNKAVVGKSRLLPRPTVPRCADERDLRFCELQPVLLERIEQLYCFQITSLGHQVTILLTQLIHPMLKDIDSALRLSHLIGGRACARIEICVPIKLFGKFAFQVYSLSVPANRHQEDES